MIFLTILVFIVVFSILVLAHEGGHFYFARRAGIKVEEFGIGFPPKAKKLFTDKHGTVYSLNWIPIGGFVRLYGEDSTDPKVLHAKNSFASKSVLQRSMVIVAGVLMNFILAWFLMTICFTVGVKPLLVTQGDLDSAAAAGLIQMTQVLYVHEIIPGSPLSESDLKPGDLITRIDGQTVPEATKLAGLLVAGKPVELSIMRGEREGKLVSVPDKDGKLGFSVSNSPYIVYLKDLRYPFYKAPVMAAKEVGRLSYLTLKMLGDVLSSLVQKFAVPEGVAGPVGIAKMTYGFVQNGFMALLQFAALLSISLGVLNIMPFPALDGGRFLFIIFEVIARRRPNAKWEAAIHGIGFVFLMALILLVTWNDIAGLF